MLLSSLIFYGWGETRTLPLLGLSIFIGYCAGLGMERCRAGCQGRPDGNSELVKRSRSCGVKVWFWSSIAAELGFLMYFKYADFFIENVNRITGWSIPLLRVLLPVGISFYTFQIISYLVDVYRGTVEPQRNFIDFAMYVCLFTQLVAGPIIRYTDITGQLRNRKTELEDVRIGIRRLILGLSKKVLLADSLGEFCQTMRTSAEPSVLFLWLSAIAFTLQIYFDFSGYSDMAIGLGRIFGFHFPENFRYPYCAESITDFWRRWHISLGAWFRDYIYIPLGGNRCRTGKWICNILIVWLLTGFWHGAEWNFVIWGLFFAVVLVLEKLVRAYGSREEHSEKVQKSGRKLLSHVYVLFLVILSFVIFQESDFVELGSTLSGMFGFGHLPLFSPETWYYLRSFALLFLLGVIGCTPLAKKIAELLRQRNWGRTIVNIAEPLIMIGLLLVSTSYLVDGSYHPFLYFRF